MAGQADSWNDWSKVVLTELERLNASTNKLMEEFQDFKVEIAKERATKSDVDAIRNEVGILQSKHNDELNTLKLGYVNEINNAKTELQNKLNTLENSHSNKITEIKTELKFKAGLWGALAGLVPVVIGLASYLLSQ